MTGYTSNPDPKELGGIVQAAALEGDVHLEVKTDVRAGKRGNTTTLTVNGKLWLLFFYGPEAAIS